MTRQIQFNNIEHGYVIGQAAKYIFNQAADRVISVTSEGNLFGGVVYAGYTGASIQMHTAGFYPNWANRDFLWAIFHYPFVQLGCRTVFGQVSEANTRALEIDRRLGFKIVARVENVFTDGACLVLAMGKDECRWLKHQPRTIKAGGS